MFFLAAIVFKVLFAFSHKQNFQATNLIFRQFIYYYFRILWIIFVRASISHPKPIRCTYFQRNLVSLKQYISYYAKTSRSLDNTLFLCWFRISLKLPCHSSSNYEENLNIEMRHLISENVSVSKSSNMRSIFFYTNISTFDSKIFFLVRHEPQKQNRDERQHCRGVLVVGWNEKKKTKILQRHTTLRRNFPFSFFASMVLGKIYCRFSSFFPPLIFAMFRYNVSNHTVYTDRMTHIRCSNLLSPIQ